MQRLLHRRPSPALVIAGIALFVSLGGVSYGLARGSIDSREIRNNSIKSRDVRNGALVGKDFGRNSIGGPRIDESTLGPVPGADTVDGHHLARVDFRSPDNTERTQVLAFGGLLLYATCSNVGDITVSAETDTNDAMIHVATIHTREPTPANPDAVSPEFNGDNDFDIGQTVNVLPGADDGDHDVEGTLTYTRPQGTIVTVQYMAEEFLDGLGTSNDCFFVGSATVSG
jgi:hypothetical protein